MCTQKRDFLANDPLFEEALKWLRLFDQNLEPETEFGVVEYAGAYHLDDNEIQDRAFEINFNDDDRYCGIERIEIWFARRDQPRSIVAPKKER